MKFLEVTGTTAKYFASLLILACIALPIWDVSTVHFAKFKTKTLPEDTGAAFDGKDQLVSYVYIERLEWAGAVSEPVAKQAKDRISQIVSLANAGLSVQPGSIESSLRSIHEWIDTYSYYMPGDNLAFDILKPKATLDCNEKVAIFVDIATSLGIESYVAREPRHQYVLALGADGEEIHWETTARPANARFFPEEESETFNRALSPNEVRQTYSLSAILAAHRQSTLQLNNAELIGFYDAEIAKTPDSQILQVQRVLMIDDTDYQVNEFKRLYKANQSPEFKDMRARAAFVEGDYELASSLVSELVEGGYMQEWMLTHLSGWKWMLARGLNNLYRSLLPYRGTTFYTSVNYSVMMMGFIALACLLTSLYLAFLFPVESRTNTAKVQAVN